MKNITWIMVATLFFGVSIGFSNPKNVTLEGVVEATEIDDDANVQGISLMVYEEKDGETITTEYAVVKNSKSAPLFELTGEIVTVTGSVKEGVDGTPLLSVISFKKVTQESEEPVQDMNTEEIEEEL
ncbi:MAG: hypothetical protein HQK83_01005 [Fibrobacteria bacterium]|nr:hypothetical protein [Fibrobacteria bacterium]